MKVFNINSQSITQSFKDLFPLNLTPQQKKTASIVGIIFAGITAIYACYHIMKARRITRLTKEITALEETEKDKILAKHKQILELDPKNYNSLVYFSLNLYEGNPKEANNYFKRALAAAPKNASTLSFYALNLLEQGRFEETHLCSERALQIDPSDYNVLETYIESVNNPDQIEQAIGKCKTFLSKSPKNLGNNRIQPLFADLLRRSGRLKEAIQCFKDLLGNSKPSLFVLNSYADTLLQNKEFDQAIEKFKEALELDPTNLFSLSGRAEALRQKGSTVEAITQFEEILQSHPDDAFILSRYAAALLQNGQIDKAIENFNASLALDAEDAFAKEGLAQAEKMHEERRPVAV